MHPHESALMLEHGGDLAAARAQFPGAPEPFLDLSTGINPFAYRFASIPAQAFTRLPLPEDLARLAAIAAKTYGVGSPKHVVPGPGVQILLPIAAALVPPARTAVLAPTYAEHARIAALVGHRVQEVTDVAQLAHAELAILVNPNNPDGRITRKAEVLELAEQLRRRGGLLIVDEAFMDAGPREESLAGEVGSDGNVVVLRSFGKFYGLPGLRLGFALTDPQHAARLAAMLGPWPLSGPALIIGQTALADDEWAQATREKLRLHATRLDRLLLEAGVELIGGTPLFRLAQTQAAAHLYNQLGLAGIFVRRFSRHPTWLRFGLPGEENAWQRLAAALNSGGGQNHPACSPLQNY
jgi:cobalamin biosynthetic protein CobC